MTEALNSGTNAGANSSSEGRRFPAHWLRFLAIAVLYFASARLGLVLAFPHTNASPVWPPSGIALAAFLWLGRPAALPIALGALAANWLSFFGDGSSLFAAFLMTAVVCAGNTAEAGLSAYAVRRWCHGDPFRDVQCACRFIVAAALTSVVAASLGTAVLLGSGLAPGQAPFVWWTWWMGDAAGQIIVTPLLLAWTARRDSLPLPFQARPRRFEAVVLGVLTFTLGAYIFGAWPFRGGTIYPLAYLPIPCLIWAAFRFGRRGATAGLVLISILAVWGTTHDSGPFASPHLNQSLLLLQTFMGVLSMSVLFLCAALCQRDRDQGELLQARDQLEIRVQERTAELEASHQEVRQSYERLQHVEGLRASLTHMIFHDLRTPLSALNYLLQMLEADSLSATQRSTVSYALQSGQTLSGIIGDLLDIHVMETGVLNLKCHPVSASSFLGEAIEQIQLMADYKGVRLEREIAPDLPPVNADPQKMKRVMVNLLENALRFTPEDGLIVVGAKRRDENTLLLQVRDTGAGIAPQAFEAIFQKFGCNRPEAVEEAEEVSTGMGLTFCKMIVEAHGGTIWVESEVGEGSRFYIALPQGEATEPIG